MGISTDLQLPEPLTPREFAAALGYVRMSLSESSKTRAIPLRLRITRLAAEKLSGREVVTASYIEDTNEYLAKIGLALASVPGTLILLDVDAVYDWRRLATKNINDTLAIIIADQSKLGQWLAEMRQEHEENQARDEDEDAGEQ